jgi:alpha,alpha-trehalase
MFETAKGMLLNFADLVNQYGFIPNGGRVYYLNRSQPPVFTLMVNKYFKATGDTQLLSAVLPVRSALRPPMCVLILTETLLRLWTRSTPSG